MAKRKLTETEEKLVKMKDEKGILFNMAVTHLLDRGWSAMDDESFPKEEYIRAEIAKAEKAAEEKGCVYMLTADFVVDLWNTAREISRTASPVQFMQFCHKVDIFN